MSVDLPRWFTFVSAMTSRWVLSGLVAVLVVGCGGNAGDGQRSEGAQTIVSSAAGGASRSLDVSFRLDETAFTAPPVSWPVPFDVVAADMELDGDPDILVNWHNLARLELFENVGDHFVLRNPEGDDRSGLFENPGIPSLYAPPEQMVPRVRQAATPGVFVWHDPSPREDWYFLVIPDGEPVTLTVRGNRPLTVKGGRRFLVNADEFGGDLRVDVDAYFRVNVGYVSTQLKVHSTVPVYVGPEMRRIESGDVTLWKDDPHGVAWLDVRGTPEPDVLLTRGGMMGTLLPPHDPKVDRFFEYTGGKPIYTDVRTDLPGGYGRGRRVEWVDVDGDMVSELYIGNTDTPNSLLVANGHGGYRDVATHVGLDMQDGDTFAWIDVDGSGLDDLIFVGRRGFEVAYNRGKMRFDVRPGDDVGLVFPAGSEPDQEDLFATLSLSVLDFDSDGRLDLWLVGHGELRQHALYRATELGFTDVTEAVGLKELPPTHTYVILDVDNDGYLDAVTIGPSSWLLHNDGGQSFARRPFGAEWGLPQYTRAAAIDVDGDSRLDIALMGQRRLLARNDTPGAGNALRVRVEAAGGHPVGALVTAVYASGRVHAQRYGSASMTQYSQGSLPLHFGISPGDAIEQLIVRWPDGREETQAVGPEDTFVELRH